MEFKMPKYLSPDFSDPVFFHAPNIETKPAEQDGMAPLGFHSTSIFPEYFKIHDTWKLAEDSRMDCCVVVSENDKLDVVEFRNLKKGDQVVIGRTDECENGIYINSSAFKSQDMPHEAFSFRANRSRETAFSQDYDSLYNLLIYERDMGNIAWVLGPACAFDSDSRACMNYLIENGFANTVLAGNALATHDLEAGLFGTALGQDIYSQRPQPNGHYNHLDIINQVRQAGSMKEFVKKNQIDNGIIAACIDKNVPVILTGSIRDDGPLPEVYADVYKGQDAMRNALRKATTVICVATMLHTIASGNMLPCFRVVNGEVRPLFIYSVDVSEFALNKLSDRGSLTAVGIVTNAQDFIVMVAKGIQKKLTDLGTEQTKGK